MPFVVIVSSSGAKQFKILISDLRFTVESRRSPLLPAQLAAQLALQLAVQLTAQLAVQLARTRQLARRWPDCMYTQERRPKGRYARANSARILRTQHTKIPVKGGSTGNIFSAMIFFFFSRDVQKT